jgi:hypothetical protein
MRKANKKCIAGIHLHSSLSIYFVILPVATDTDPLDEISLLWAADERSSYLRSVGKYWG